MSKKQDLNTLKTYKVYLKKAGSHITLKRYNQDMFIGYSIKRDSYIKSKEGEKLERSIYRTRNNLIDIINCNVSQYSKFITLTFRDSVLDKKQALKEFKKFSDMFRYNFGFKLSYVMVSERQKKRGLKENNAGSWHFHMVCFNDVKLDFKLLKKTWKCGSVDIKKIDSVRNIGIYIAKYITKDMLECNLNDKLIYTSQGLKRPKEYHLKEFDSNTLKGKKTYEKIYIINTYCNSVPIQCDLSEYELNLNRNEV